MIIMDKDDIKINNIQKGILNFVFTVKEFDIFVIFAFLEIKGESIISVKEFFPQFYERIEELYNKFTKVVKIPEINLIQSDEFIYIEKLKNLINNDCELLIKYLENNSNYHNLIFILEMKNGLILKRRSLYESLEKGLYLLIYDKSINIELYKFKELLKTPDSQKDYINSLQNFNSVSLFLLEQCYNNKLKKSYEIFDDFVEFYLKNILSKCNFILAKAYNKDPFELNLFKTKIFLNENKKAYISMKKNIDIQAIKKSIINYYDKKNLKGKEFFNNYIKIWLDCFYESIYIIKILDDIKKETIGFIKFFKYLKINCIILINYLSKIKDLEYISFNDKYKNKMKFICIEETNKEQAKNNLSRLCIY